MKLNLIKKFKLLLDLKFWNYFFRYYKKKFSNLFLFYLSKIKGKKYLEVDIDGLKCKICFFHYYHYLFGRNLVKGKHERVLLSLWKKRAEEMVAGEVAVDVGGYTGIYGLIAGLANPAIEVFIFEPDPVNFEHIRRSIELNNLRNTRVIKAVLSGYSGNAHFKMHEGATAGRLALDGGDLVESITLSDWTSRNNKIPNLIKFDIWGSEVDVLLASEDVLKKAKKLGILLELYPEGFQGSKEKEKMFWLFMRELGFHSVYLHPRSDGWSNYYYVFKE
jgi:FkbM family methyltransferase